MAETRKWAESKPETNDGDVLPDSAKTAAMRRREAKEKRIAGERKLWDKQHAKESEESE